jgi:membrane protein CcdC involved in cytochrome C biogenesis
MTRVDFAIPLRESWAYPFIFMQLFFVTLYMKYEVSAVKQKLALCGTFLTTLLFILFWQFAQFVLLPEVMSMFGMWLLGVLHKEKVSLVVDSTE